MIQLAQSLWRSKLFTQTKALPGPSRGVVRFSAYFVVLALLFLPAACGTQIQAPAGDGENNNQTTNGAANGVRAAASEVAPIDPLILPLSQAPTRLQIPDLGLDASVVEMGWQIVMVNGERTTRWVVPETELGWHANSAGVGSEGNMILSGRQVGNNAPLAALALGEIQPGQEVYVTDADGLEFVYRIVEVSDPIPSIGASDADLARAQAYFAVDLNDSATSRLTLATGWPDFTTTHRIFAVGELEGVAR